MPSSHRGINTASVAVIWISHGSAIRKFNRQKELKIVKGEKVFHSFPGCCARTCLQFFLGSSHSSVRGSTCVLKTETNMQEKIINVFYKGFDRHLYLPTHSQHCAHKDFFWREVAVLVLR